MPIRRDGGRLRTSTPAVPDEALIAQGLASLSRLDQAFWGRKMERRLRNPKSFVWVGIPKDGVKASTLGFVARLWVQLPFPLLFFPGILLVDLPTDGSILTGLGFVLIGSAVVVFFIGLNCVRRASKARRAWRREHA